MFAIALFAIIGAALKLSGGLAIAYWVCFGIFSVCHVISTVANIAKIVKDDE